MQYACTQCAEILSTFRSQQAACLEVLDGKITNYTEGGLFQVLCGCGYFKLATDLAISLACDGVPLFTKSQFLVTLLIVQNLNLPMSERVKQQNLICLGILPGLALKGQLLGSFLLPLIAELKLFETQSVTTYNAWTGESFPLKIHLLYCSGDLPASASLAGCTSHNSAYPC